MRALIPVISLIGACACSGAIGYVIAHIRLMKALDATSAEAVRRVKKVFTDYESDSADAAVVFTVEQTINFISREVTK